MILVDASVWIDHLRYGNALLAERLNAGRVLVHPFVIGEIALGQLRQRELVLSALSSLPRAEVATEEEAMRFIEREALYGRGVGYVDVHLLAAVRLTAGTRLWTNDKRLGAVAEALGLALDPTG